MTRGRANGGQRVLSRPWGTFATCDEDGIAVISPHDCPGIRTWGGTAVPDTASLTAWVRPDGSQHAVLSVRYGRDVPELLRYENMPRRPPEGTEPRDEAEREGAIALDRMNAVLARVTDLEHALDEPARVWERLDAAWRRAVADTEPRMAEIVRQARLMPRRLDALGARLRHVLRRTRERVPVSRAQQMDRASLIWLSRQPGRTLAERAGADQRVLAVARHASHDTAENRVLRAYAELARDVGRDWCRENAGASAHPRYGRVEGLTRRAARLARDLSELGVGRAEPGATPNYVLMADPDYRAVREAWERLLRRRREIDDLWGWQARTWTEFTALALVLALRDVPGAELVACAPLSWRTEHDRGRHAAADNPLAVFHLPAEGLVIEVQDAPRRVEVARGAIGAALWLRVSDLSGGRIDRRVPVWPLHAFAPLDPRSEAAAAASAVRAVLRDVSVGAYAIAEGLVVVPAPVMGDNTGVDIINGGEADHADGPFRVTALALGPRGDGLASGRAAMARFARSLTASISQW